MEYQHDGGVSDHLFLGEPLLSSPDYIPPLDRPYVIDDLLLTGQVSMLAGPPNIGKSSVVASIAANAALGRNIGEMSVRRCLVLYIAAEDPEGIAERSAGYWREAPHDTAHFYIHCAPVDLTDGPKMAAVQRDAAKLKAEVEADQLLVIFDTLNLCIGDSDENSSRDMGKVVASARELARAVNAHVMLVHHTSAGDQGKARGSSALPANIDTLLMLRLVEHQGERSIVMLTQEKQRSTKKGQPLIFENSAIVLGHNREGKPRTAPIARYAVPTPAMLDKIKTKRTPGSEVNARAVEVLRVLRALDRKTPKSVHETKDIAVRVSDGFGALLTNPDSLRKAVKRALDVLVAEGKVEAESGGFRVVACVPKTGSQGDPLH